MRISFATAVCLALPFLSALPVCAVQSSGGQTASTSSWEPDSVTAWDYVGSIGSASGVYLGNYGGSYWVMTAAHVGMASFRLGGYSYSAVSDSLKTISPNGDATHVPDLVLFRIDPGNGQQADYINTLDALALRTTQLATGADVRLVGHGDDDDSKVIKSWGDNRIAGLSEYKIKDRIYGGQGYYTLDQYGVSAVKGDSGGGVFHWTGGRWELSAIMSATGTISTYGDGMLAIRLDAYADQILGIIPEPASWVTLVAVLALALSFAARSARSPMCRRWL